MIPAPGTSMRLSDETRAEARDRATSQLRLRFLHGSEPGLPKHAQLRKAIVAAIGDGALNPGEQLAPEQALTVALGLSLGTVRRALDQLAVAGVLRREHGRGTFVAQPPHAITDNWHFHFFALDGRSVLPVYARVVERGLVHLADHGARCWARTRKGSCASTACSMSTDGSSVTASFMCRRRASAPC